MSIVRGVDGVFARVVFSPVNWLLGSATTLALVGFAVTDVGRDLIGLRRWTPIALLATWPLVYGLAVSRGAVLVEAPRLEWLRLLVVAHAVAATMALGAAAPEPVSAFWAAPFVLLPCWAQAFPGARYAGFSLLAVPLRWVLADEPSVGSLAFAAGVSAVLGASHLALGTKHRWHSARAARRDAITGLGADSAERAAAMATAMDLHDGLSGLVLLCRTRARAGAFREAEQLVRESRAFLAAFDGHVLRDTDDLERLARRLEVELVLDERGSGIDVDLRAQALDVAAELIANEARHGSLKRIDLRLRASAGAVRLSASGSPFRPAERGRGLRNVSRRVAALGGRIGRPPRGHGDLLRWHRRARAGPVVDRHGPDWLGGDRRPRGDRGGRVDRAHRREDRVRRVVRVGSSYGTASARERRAHGRRRVRATDLDALTQLEEEGRSWGPTRSPSSTTNCADPSGYVFEVPGPRSRR